MNFAEILQYDEAVLRPLLIGRAIRVDGWDKIWHINDIRWTSTSILLVTEDSVIRFKLMGKDPLSGEPDRWTSLPQDRWEQFLRSRSVDIDLMDLIA